MTRPFVIDPDWADLLHDLGIRRADLLRRAGVPEDLFSRERPFLAPDDYYRFWQAMALATGSETPGLTLGQRRAEQGFDPSMFAVRCSPDLASAVGRLAAFKALNGPIRYEVHDTLGGLEVSISAEDTLLPAEIMVAELVSLLQVMRMVTQEDLRPIAVELREPPRHPQYASYFGRPLRKGTFDRIVLGREMAARPLPSPAPALFEPFDPDLRPRLDELDPTATVSLRVQTALMEALAGGRADAALVAERLGASTRSLQRRLSGEKTTFKAELQSLRERLARHYLQAGISGAEIALLLGYDDPNSFIRAFHDWTGTTPEAMRKRLLKGR